MKYKLQDLIDVEQFQALQDRLNEIYSFPSAIIDNDGNILTATGWQDICAKFHRQNKECEKDCIKSDQYILSHLAEANPAVSYRCPHGLVDNATPIIIDGVHLGNFFTGQFFLEEPDLEFFRTQAKRYGFDERAYLEAVSRVPVWTQEKLNSYLFFVRGLIEVISGTGLKNLRAIEARRKIEESEKQFQAMFELASIGIAQADPHTGQWVRVNQKMCDITGYTAEEMLALRVPDITHPEDRERDWEAYQRVVRGEAPNYRLEKRYIRKDGTVVWVSVNMTVIRDAAGQPLRTMATLEDITARKQAEEGLCQNEELFRRLFTHSPVGVVMVGADFRFQRCNETFCRFLGYRESELTGRTFLDVTFPEDRTVGAGEIQSILRNELDFAQFQKRYVRKDGKVVWGEVHVRMVRDQRGAYFLTNVHDITERKQAEEALRRNERLYRSLFENMLNGFAYCRMLFEEGKPQDFIYLAVNDAFESLTGLKNVVGRKVSDVIPGIREADPRLIEIYGRVALTGQPERFEMFVEALQMWFWISVYSPEREYFVAVFDVITERKQAEEKLREISGRLRLATASAKAGVWDWNLQTNKMIWDDRMLELYGLTRENFTEGIEAWEQGLHAEDSSRAIEECQAALRGEQEFDTEFRVRRPDGTVVHIKANGLVLRDEEGRPLRMIGLNTDISERKRIEEEVATILRTTIDGYYLVDMAGRFLDTNDAYCRMIGYSRGEILKMSIKDIEAIDTDDVIRARIQRIMETGYARFDTKHVRKDGKVIDIEASVNRLEGAQGKLVVFMRDITERKQAEEEKAKLEAQLLQAQKMESVGRLAGGVAHDFNNMLGVILGHAEMALDQVDPAHPLHADLEEIHKAASRSADLTRQLLAFARKQTVAPKVLDLNETVAGMLKMLQRLIGEDIISTGSRAENLWPVKVDPSQIDQILANLCVNARDAIADVGKITIETGNKQHRRGLLRRSRGFRARGVCDCWP